MSWTKRSRSLRAGTPMAPLSAGLDLSQVAKVNPFNGAVPSGKRSYLQKEKEKGRKEGRKERKKGCQERKEGKEGREGGKANTQGRYTKHSEYCATN